MSGPGGAGGRGVAAPSRRPVRAALHRFWADDQGLSAFSAVLFVAVFVVPPLVPPGSGRSLAGDVASYLLLVSGVHALGERRFARVVLMPVALVTMAVDLASRFVAVAEPLAVGFNRLSLLLLLAVVLGRTLRADPVTSRRLHPVARSLTVLEAVAGPLYLAILIARLVSQAPAPAPASSPRTVPPDPATGYDPRTSQEGR